MRAPRNGKVAPCGEVAGYVIVTFVLAVLAVAFVSPAAGEPYPDSPLSRRGACVALDVGVFLNPETGPNAPRSIVTHYANLRSISSKNASDKREKFLQAMGSQL